MHALDSQTVHSSRELPQQQESFVETLERSPLSLLNSLFFQTQFPAIKECDCYEFDRHRYPQFKTQFEDTIIEQASRLLPEKEKVVRLLDVGAGGCFQTLAILDKFLKAGYKNIELTLVDKCYAKSNCFGSHNSVEQFQKFVREELLSKYSDATVNIKIETEIQQVFGGYSEMNEPPHIVLMIDIQAERFDNDKSLLDYCKDFILQNKAFSTKTLLVTTSFCRTSRGSLGDNFDYGTCMTKGWHQIAKMVRTRMESFCTVDQGKEHGIIFEGTNGLEYRKVEEK
jgi:hypothetical protein